MLRSCCFIIYLAILLSSASAAFSNTFAISILPQHSQGLGSVAMDLLIHLREEIGQSGAIFRQGLIAIPALLSLILC